MHKYAFKRSYPKRADIIELGYSEIEAKNALKAIEQFGGEPHLWWMSLAGRAKA